MKLNTSGEWASGQPQLKSAGKRAGGTLTTGWLLLAASSVLGLVPGLGFLLYIVGIPVLIAVFVLSIVAMAKSRPVAGTFLMLATLIVAPVVFLLLPLLSFGMAQPPVESVEEPANPDLPGEGWVTEELE